MDDALSLVRESSREGETALAEPPRFEAFFEEQARTLFRRLCAVTGNAAEAEESQVVRLTQILRDAARG